MNRHDIMLAIVDLGRTGKAATPEDAISYLSEFIGQLDPAHEDYEHDVQALMNIGACIWQLQNDLQT